MPGSLTADGMAITTDYTVRCETSKFGSLLYGDEMIIGGITYQVREVRLVDDGTFVEISLMRLDSGTAAVGRDPREGLKLSDLTDVGLISPQAGESLKYDGSQWVDATDEGTAYVFTQSTPAATWTINHNLGFVPSVELFNSGSQEIDGDVVHTSANQTVVTFTGPVAGFARLV